MSAPGSFLSRITPSERRLIKAAGWVCLFVEGYKGQVPRDFGDNEGVWPSRVRLTGGDPRQRARDADYDNPIHHVFVHASYWFRWPHEAERVAERAAAVLRDQQEPLNHAWHNLTPWRLDELIRWALMVEDVECFSDDHVERWGKDALQEEANRKVRARF